MSRLIKFIADLRIAILLLLFIIVFSILGSIIEQEKTLEFYKTSYPIIKNNLFNPQEQITWKKYLKAVKDYNTMFPSKFKI